MQRGNRRKERGQTLVEFALTLPVLLLVLIGIIDFGRVFFVYAESSNSLRQALRQAPNIGFGSGTPSYRNCDRIRDIADNVTAATVTVNIQYYFGTSTTPVTCSAGLNDSQFNNGDRMVITTTANLDLWVLPTTLNMNFVGQRTIVKTLDIGASSGDYDYDGLGQGWETYYWGSESFESGLGDYDCDGVTNGAEEALCTNPTLPMECDPAKPTVAVTAPCS